MQSLSTYFKKKFITLIIIYSIFASFIFIGELYHSIYLTEQAVVKNIAYHLNAAREELINSILLDNSEKLEQTLKTLKSKLHFNKIVYIPKRVQAFSDMIDNNLSYNSRFLKINLNYDLGTYLSDLGYISLEYNVSFRNDLLNPIMRTLLVYLVYIVSYIILVIILYRSLKNKIINKIFSIIEVLKLNCKKLLSKENKILSKVEENDYLEFKDLIEYLEFLLCEFEKMSHSRDVIIKQYAKYEALYQTSAMLAHDVKKPFTQAKALLAMYDDFMNNPEQLRKAKKDIDKTIKNVESMLSDITDYAREVKLETKPVSVVNILDFSIRQIAQNYTESNINFEYILNNTYKVLADDERLVRVFNNIIGNGIEAIVLGKEKSQEHGTITLTTKDIVKEDKKYIEIIIANNGPLFKEEDIPNLFDSFFTNFTKGKKKGTGLGLASAHKTVTLHGGNILAKNKDTTQGVEFLITLPASLEKENRRKQTLPKTIREAAFIELKKNSGELEVIADTLSKANRHFKILLLEDEALYRASVRNTVKSNNTLNRIITLYDAQNVDDALTLVEHEKITHAIVDIDLGQTKDGYDFLSQVKERFPNLMSMVHSNRHLDEFRQKAFSLGAKAFVPKPLALEHLVDFLHESVGTNLCVRPLEGRHIGLPLQSNYKILVIDDDPMILNMNGNVLIEYFESPQLFKVSKPEKGLELIKKYTFDYIFCDINFDNSNIDGYALVRRIREQHKEVKIYLVSSMPRVIAEEATKNSGADGFIEQPMTVEKIRKVCGCRLAVSAGEEKQERKPLTANRKPNPFLAKLFHDLNRPYVELYNFFRDYEVNKEKDSIGVAKKERLLALSEHASYIRTLLLRYLEQNAFTIEDRETRERITKELQAMNELTRRPFMQDKEVDDGENRDKTYS